MQGKQKTHEEFLEDIKRLNINVTVLERYVNNVTSILVKCDVCGHEWAIRPGNLLSGRGCPKCAKVYKRTHGDFVYEMSQINPNIRFNGIFKNIRQKIACECLVCGHKWDASPGALLRKHGCPHCASLNRVKSNEEFISQIKEIHPNIQILDEYQKNNIKIRCKCLVCNNVWMSKPNGLLNGYGCPECGKNRKSNDEFLKELYALNSDVRPLEPYHRSLEKIKCECLKCGHLWHTTPAILLQGKGCPKCVASKLEKATESFLIRNKIDFIPQKKFDGLVGRRNCPLSYDFYIPNKKILIELQGKQHYTSIDYFGGDSFLAKQQEYDKRKREFAVNNGYVLLEISYLDFNKIENILYDRLIS